MALYALIYGCMALSIGQLRLPFLQATNQTIARQCSVLFCVSRRLFLLLIDAKIKDSPCTSSSFIVAVM